MTYATIISPYGLPISTISGYSSAVAHPSILGAPLLSRSIISPLTVSHDIRGIASPLAINGLGLGLASPLAINGGIINGGILGTRIISAWKK